jgi:hypothetical protein
MISNHLFLLPSPSCDEENSIKKFNISKIFAVKSPAYRKWIEEQIENGLDTNGLNTIEFHSFENIETISNSNDDIKSPTLDDLDWIHQHISNGENVGIMCANGFQRAIPVLCKYTNDILDMSTYETILKVKDVYPYAITNPKVYSEFIETLDL